MKIYKANLVRVFLLILVSLSFQAKAKMEVTSSGLKKLGTKMSAFQTYDGTRIEVKSLKDKNSALSALLSQRESIELENGEIFYPEEVEYVFRTKSYGPSIFSARAPGGHD